MKKSEKRIDLYVDSEWSSNQELLSFQVVYRDLQNIEKKVSDSDRIIKNLLFYTSIRTPEPADVVICDLLKDCIEVTREIFRLKPTSVRMRCGLKVCQIFHIVVAP
jgi:hypothetical protein